MSEKLNQTASAGEAEIVDKSQQEAREEIVMAHPPPPGFLSAEQLLQRLPISRGTLRNWIKAGKLPVIRLTGRRLLFDWESVRTALLRRQRGGAQ
jgi:excisionase family DNA binding protein